GFRASMVFACNFVKNSSYFQVIVCLCSQASAICRSNFWCVEICNTCTRWSIHDVISRVLIGPSGVQSSLPCELKDSVDVQEAVWIDRCAAFTAVEWECCGINAAATINFGRVEINGFIIDYLGPFGSTVRARGRKVAIITIVIENAS